MTHDEMNTAPTLVGLQRLLDTLGADRSRWPARERLKYSAFLAESAAARERLAEAEALETILDSVREPDIGPLDALSARIMAAATASAPDSKAAPSAEGTVVSLRPRPVTRPASAPEIGWQAAALLAASVMLGVFVGISGVAVGPVETLTSIITSEAPSDAEGDEDVSPLALGGEEIDTFEVEELL